MRYEIGEAVEVWDGDVRRWVAGKVQGFKALPSGVEESGEFMVVNADEPDTGPLAVNKVPSVYAIADYGFVRKAR